MPAPQVISREGRIDRVCGVELTYSYRQDGEVWMYRELRLGESREGFISFADTLWEQLERDGGYRLRVRAGSF